MYVGVFQLVLTSPSGPLPNLMDMLTCLSSISTRRVLNSWSTRGGKGERKEERGEGRGNKEGGEEGRERRGGGGGGKEERERREGGWEGGREGGRDREGRKGREGEGGEEEDKGEEEGKEGEVGRGEEEFAWTRDHYSWLHCHILPATHTRSSSLLAHL